MREYEAELAAREVQVMVVTFDGDFLAEAYVRQTGLKWPLLMDGQMELYQGYGLQRASWWDIYRPSSIARYLSIIWRGTRPGRPGEDLQQLGGDVVIDPQQRVALHHLSEDPHDRPPIAQLLQLVGIAVRDSS